MAASSKKGGAKSQPPPIEGEILTEEESASSAKKSRNSGGVDYLRRFLWYLAGAGAIFIAGLVAAPTIQEGIDSLFGGNETARIAPEEAVAVETEAAQVAQMEIAAPVEEEISPAPEVVPEEIVAAPPEPETDVVEVEVAAEDVGEIARRLDALETRLTALEAGAVQGPSDSDSDRRIAGLEARLAEMETGERLLSVGSSTDGLLLALARMSQRVRAGQAFSGEMLELRTLIHMLPEATRAGNQAHITTLRRLANSGVRNPATLRRSFAGLLPAALEAAALPADAGWWDKVWAGLKSVVVVRRTGQVEGEGTQAVLARMEFHLAEDDIAAALAEVKGLEPRVKDVLLPWQAEATDSLAARQAVAALIEYFSRQQFTPSSIGRRSPATSTPGRRSPATSTPGRQKAAPAAEGG